MTPPEIARGAHFSKIWRRADRDLVNVHEAQWREFCQVPIRDAARIDRARDP